MLDRRQVSKPWAGAELGGPRCPSAAVPCMHREMLQGLAAAESLAPGSKGGLLVVLLCQRFVCCCGEAAGIAASLGGGGRLVALSLTSFLFSCLQQLNRHVLSAGSRAGLLAAASGRALARKERNGPCWQPPCWHFHLGEGSLLALALSPGLGMNRRSELPSFLGIAFPRKEHLASERGNCCFCV